MLKHKTELHFSQRSGWLRAAVLGANDGIVSTASLMLGMAAANAARDDVVLAGVAGLVAGAMSMAAGEYVSVSSQADTEAADLHRERHELEHNTEFERQELAAIYVGRGLDAELAQQVSAQLMAHDALASHARDELGLSELHLAKPLQAALASAGTFALGAALPLMLGLFSPAHLFSQVLAVGSLITLAVLGGLAANAGGAPLVKGAVRVLFWGAMAMLATMLVGKAFGVMV